jgi:hypothetical protein
MGCEDQPTSKKGGFTFSAMSEKASFLASREVIQDLL